MNKKLKGLELFSLLKLIDNDEIENSLYVDVFWNISENNENEIDFKIPYKNYKIDYERNVIDIINDEGDLIFRLPYRR